MTQFKTNNIINNLLLVIIRGNMDGGKKTFFSSFFVDPIGLKIYNSQGLCSNSKRVTDLCSPVFEGGLGR